MLFIVVGFIIAVSYIYDAPFLMLAWFFFSAFFYMRHRDANMNHPSTESIRSIVAYDAVHSNMVKS